MISPARLAAYEILTAISSERADLPTAVAHARERLRDDRDRALAAEIAHGVQRWRARLDFLIAAFSKRRFDKLDPEIVEILRLSAYQLLYLSRVPASAVVDDAVNMAGRAGKRSAGGMVNAVLRAISRSRDKLPVPPRPSSHSDRAATLEYLSVSLSHPRWLAERWLDRLGFAAAEAWMLFNNNAAPITLRANRLRVTREALQAQLSADDVDCRPGRFAPDALIVERGLAAVHAAVDDGRALIQDESSQIVSLLAGETPGPLVLDTCSSPGGKTTAIAVANPSSIVVAADVRARRMRLVADTVQRTGVTNVRLVQADLLAGLPCRDRFSCVFVDAPCSGLGTLRRDPDLRWRRQAADLSSLAADQQVMLRQAANAVAPGGRLVYATCSSEPEENDDVVDAFLRQQPDFRAVSRDRLHAALPRELVGDDDRLRTAPDRHALEAFFGAVFERVR